MSKKVDLDQASSEKEKINQVIDEFYVKNGKKEGEAYETVSQADWKLAWALLRLAESVDRVSAQLQAWREENEKITKKFEELTQSLEEDVKGQDKKFDEFLRGEYDLTKIRLRDLEMDYRQED